MSKFKLFSVILFILIGFVITVYAQPAATPVILFLRQLRDVLITEPQGGQYLRYDDNTSKWINQSGGGGGGGEPGGSNTQVQFNDSGAFGGDSGLTYSKSTNTLTISGPGKLEVVGDILFSSLSAPSSETYMLTISDDGTLDSHPTALSQLTDDSTHRLVTDTEKTTWNNKLSSVPDGDKGDITVSSTGTVFSIDNNAVTTDKINNGAVTLAKMANMATASLLGRSTAESGVPEVLSASTARTLLNVADGANNYSLPTASDSVLGGIKVGSGLSISDGVLSATGGGEKCIVLDNVTASDDNMLFGSFADNRTIKNFWCHYQGSAPTTAAEFTLGTGTHTAPTCAGPTSQATAQTVTSGSLSARTPLRFSVTNTPNPATDTYQLCVEYE